MYSSMQKSYHYIGLLKAVMRLSMTSLKAADAKDVASSITAIANEKLKAEKEAAAGKKKTGKLFLLSFFVFYYYFPGSLPPPPISCYYVIFCVV